ncbi:hypothetical protein EYC84_010451 [Monilinia fructicola]|uniref:Uncharacterized protein n=1 Tax=Monilinia fructicola TaxID=38448 RepID=A0A5M9JI80_MONFR|nr:hypothetical protein EYC84_010451 [Monilinia fructicola]
MISDTGIGSTVFEIASNVALSSGEYKWNIPPGLDINNVEFPPWAILSNCEGTQALSGAFWVNDMEIYKRDDGNSSDKTTRFPNGSSDTGSRTSSISTGAGGDSSTSAKAGNIEASTTTSGNSSISISVSISDISTSTMNSLTHTHPTLLATSTTTPSTSEVKKNSMPMIVGIIVGISGLFVLVIVFVIIRHRDKHGQPLTLPWKMRGDSNALELETTANLHEMEGPGKFELDGTGMKEKMPEIDWLKVEMVANLLRRMKTRAGKTIGRIVGKRAGVNLNSVKRVSEENDLQYLKTDDKGYDKGIILGWGRREKDDPAKMITQSMDSSFKFRCVMTVQSALHSTTSLCIHFPSPTHSFHTFHSTTQFRFTLRYHS